MNVESFTVNWNYPTNIRLGIGRVNELVQVCQQLQITAPLLITDPKLSEMAMVRNAIGHCRAKGLACGSFSAISSNPTLDNIGDGIAAFERERHDGVIAFGGGSAIDAAKAVALMVGQELTLWDVEDVADNWTRVNVDKMVPVIAIPTTSGTGAEVGRTSVITDEFSQVKRLIFHPQMMPKVVILDPELTVGLPAHLTAATGLDALSHALEAYCTTSYHPMAEGIALEAIRLIKNYLPRACADGQDLEARTQVMVASTMGATAFQRGLGAMHALAHPLGAIYNSHHGLLNAILMPYVLLANKDAIAQRIKRLAHYIELANPSFDGFLQWILSLRQQLAIPDNLNQIGINQQRASQIGEMAYKDPSAAGNPVSFTPAQYSEIFIAAVNGERL